jgi:hypothetical protein
MAGKPRNPNKQYSPHWGGRRVPNEKMVKGFTMARWQAEALKVLGEGDIQRGFNLVMQNYKHL